jgi:peptidoglycan/xylan/chitin deacetylase (PgdA/CDA1 family)
MENTVDARVRASRPILILMYHQVGLRPPLPAPLDEVLMPRQAFERQMAALHRTGWRGVSLTELEPYLRGEKHGKVVGITMDDGYVDCLHHAVPVLHKFGFSATCYAVSARRHNEWDWQQGVPRLSLMNAPELREWVAAGNDVGGHTRTHVRLDELDDLRAREEIFGCKQELEERIGAEVRHFSYPYGLGGPQHEAMVREAGYVTATTSTSRRAFRQNHLLALPRFTALPDTRGLQICAWAYLGTERLRAWAGALRGSRHGAGMRLGST